MDVEQCNDKPRSIVVAPDTACSLNVFGMRLRLPEHDHQPEPRNIQAHRDHVGRDGAIHSLLIIELAFQSSSGLRDLVGGDSGRQFQDL